MHSLDLHDLGKLRKVKIVYGERVDLAVIALVEESAILLESKKYQLYTKTVLS
jgi:hypothetical protein